PHLDDDLRDLEASRSARAGGWRLLEELEDNEPAPILKGIGDAAGIESRDHRSQLRTEVLELQHSIDQAALLGSRSLGIVARQDGEALTLARPVGEALCQLVGGSHV